MAQFATVRGEGRHDFARALARRARDLVSTKRTTHLPSTPLRMVRRTSASELNLSCEVGSAAGGNLGDTAKLAQPFVERVERLIAQGGGAGGGGFRAFLRVVHCDERFEKRERRLDGSFRIAVLGQFGEIGGRGERGVVGSAGGRNEYL